MHHMIPLADAEALTAGTNLAELAYESIDHVTDYTAEIVVKDTTSGAWYMFTAEYGTRGDGSTYYGFDTVIVEGNECVRAVPVVRQTQTVTRWVPRAPRMDQEDKGSEQR